MIGKAKIIGGTKVNFIFGGEAKRLSSILNKRNTILLSDENVALAHPQVFKGWKSIIIKSGEEEKNAETVDRIIQALIQLEVDRSFTLVGIGGGVITDLAGYIASVYMRGIGLVLLPTTLLCMIDAAIGGKNGINHQNFKNMIGTIRQPSHIIYDYKLLQSLPRKEWVNGFAEIIKHAAIADSALFKKLEEMNIDVVSKQKNVLAELINRNVLIKSNIVQNDVNEQGLRKLLNFGHTLGHAVEIHENLMHGEAVAIGMCFASQLSEQMLGFRYHNRFLSLVRNYGLPTELKFNKEKVVQSLVMDKKREGAKINFILLEKVGKAAIHPIPVTTLIKSLK